MPKRVKLSTEAMVANVNKVTPKKVCVKMKKDQADKAVHDKSMKKKTTFKATNEDVGKKQFSKRCKEIANESKQANVNARSRSMDQQDVNYVTHDNENSTEFVEENQLMSMTVDKDDSFYESDSDAVYDEMDQSDTQSDSDEEMTSEQSNQRPPQPTTSYDRDEEIRYNQEHLKQIDVEMKECILQLHECMAKGGLNESLELLKQCFDLKTGKPKGKKGTNKMIKCVSTDKNSNGNSNLINHLDTISRNDIQECS